MVLFSHATAPAGWSSSSQSVWSELTWAGAGTELVLEDTGNIVLYGADGSTLFESWNQGY
jgi:hypothetical protein